MPLLTVPSRRWHHQGLVATSDWIAFVCGYCTGSLYRTNCCVYSTTWRKDHLGPFYGFKSKRLFWINLKNGNNDTVACVPILSWPAMMSSLKSHGSINDDTQHFFLKFVSCATIWYKNVPLDTLMYNVKGKPMLWKFALYINYCVFQEDNTTENISMHISSSQFYKHTIRGGGGGGGGGYTKLREQSKKRLAFQTLFEIRFIKIESLPKYLVPNPTNFRNNTHLFSNKHLWNNIQRILHILYATNHCWQTYKWKGIATSKAYICTCDITFRVATSLHIMFMHNS